jgi:predicted esterase
MKKPLSPEITFDEFSVQIREHFTKETYVDGLEYADGYVGKFPKEEPLLQYWRMCLAARLENYPLTNQILEGVLASGTWYGEALLRESPSLEPLQNDPEFKRLANISLKMQQNDPTDALPILVVRPEGKCGVRDDPCPLLIFLHGNTDSAQANLEHWTAAANNGWLAALPQSSEVMWAGAYFWSEHEASAKEVDALYKKLPDTYNLDLQRTVLAGFSMGAELALWLALSGRIPAKGFILLGPGGPFMDDIEEWEPLIEQAKNRDLRGVIITGQADTSIPHKNIRELVEKFNANGIPCELEEHIDLAHEYPANFEERLLHSLDFIFKA